MGHEGSARPNLNEIFNNTESGTFSLVRKMHQWYVLSFGSVCKPNGDVNMFTILKKDEQAKNSLVISDDVATIQHTSVHPTVAPKDQGLRAQLTWHFDYTDVTREELVDIATRHLVIQKRTEFKNLDAPGQEWDGKSFSVREYLDTERRKPKDRKSEALKAVANLSEEEKAELIQQLTAND